MLLTILSSLAALVASQTINKYTIESRGNAGYLPVKPGDILWQSIQLGAVNTNEGITGEILAWNTIAGPLLLKQTSIGTFLIDPFRGSINMTIPYNRSIVAFDVLDTPFMLGTSIVQLVIGENGTTQLCTLDDTCHPWASPNAIASDEEDVQLVHTAEKYFIIYDGNLQIAAAPGLSSPKVNLLLGSYGFRWFNEGNQLLTWNSTESLSILSCLSVGTPVDAAKCDSSTPVLVLEETILTIAVLESRALAVAAATPTPRTRTSR